MTPGAMVAIDTVCFAFLMVVLSAYTILPRDGTLKKDSFFYSLLFLIIAIVFDTLAWLCEVVPSPRAFQYLCNFMSLILTSVIVVAFAYYIVELINEKQPMPKTPARIVAAVNIIGAVSTVTGAFCGKVFDIYSSAKNPAILVFDDGGFFYELPIMISALSIVFLFVLVIRYSKVLGKQKLAVFSVYFLLPIITGVMEVVFDNIQLSYVATSISMLIVYIMLQSSRMNEMILREEILREFSYVDQLTGLLNRRAYDRDLDALGKEDDVQVIFCDLNGLKRVNDREGHYAGDRFLISFAEILLKNFPREFVYRISGDEFVIVTRNGKKEEFEKNNCGLKEDIAANDNIASLGIAEGTGDNIHTLIKEAEKYMYDNKNEFYALYPDRRR